MLKRVGETAFISLTVEQTVDGVTTPVTNDIPYVTIQNVVTKKYYNGLQWQDTLHKLYMTHTGSGIYTYGWLLFTVGSFEIKATSDAYVCSNIIGVTAYDENTVYPWILASQHDIQFTSAAEATLAKILIRNESGYYWNGTAFSPAESILDMSVISAEAHVFGYQITFPAVGKYLIFAYNGVSEPDHLLYSLAVVVSESDIIPVEVSSETLVGLDGTNCIVVDEVGAPVSGAEVAAYNPDTKLVIGRATTNADGTWAMHLRPGTYLFTFQKSGYDSVSFERVVS